MLTIVVGGFIGDEGKGKIVGYLAHHDQPDLVVRAGAGPQAGHTVVSGQKVTQIPSGFTNPRSRLLIARGTVINPAVVLKEIAEFGIEDRIGLDFGCTIIEPKHIEQELEMKKRIGSVGSGTGPARADRILRKAKIAKETKSLAPYLTDVAEETNQAIRKNKNILVETAQGFALSLLDYRFYPYVTSQDTTACQFAADLGIGPKAIDEIMVVYKAYVSRVGQGFIPNEWSKEEIAKYGVAETGTVSGRIRRIGPFDKKLAKESLIRNTGTQVAITCLDRMFKGNAGCQKLADLTKEARDFIDDLNQFLKASSPYFKKISLISTGPDLDDMIDLR